MRRNRFQSLSLIFLIIYLGTGLGLLGEVVPSKLKENLETLAAFFGLSYEWFWVISTVILTTLVFAVTFIKEWFDPTDKAEQANIHESKEETERRKFSADLYKRYKERCDHKLDGRSEIPLLVSDESEGTHAPQFEEAMPCIVRRFGREGRLLLVGEEGAGKTVLLLNLAKHLAEKAQRDASQPLPFVFNLATWSKDYAHFNDWATATLTKLYGLPAKDSGELLKKKSVVFLLDGLDELARPEKSELDGLDELARAKKLESAAATRAECLASLYVALDHGSISFVICCRPDELKLMRQRPDLRPPWVVGLKVHSLTPEQIDRALIRAGVNIADRFAAPNINAALGTDSAAVYQRVLSIPFYFTTALQVFDPTIPPLVDASDEEKLKSSLVVAFIEKKLQLPEKNDRRFPRAHTLDRLAWLADFLKGRVTFELSDLQPSTLKRTWVYRLLFCLFCGVVGFIVVGLHNWTTLLALFIGGLISLNSVYLITEDFGRWTLAYLKRWSTWLIALLSGVVVALLAGFLLLIDLIGRQTDGEAMSDPAYLINAFLMLIVVMTLVGVLGFIAALNVRLFIRVAFGIKGGVPLSEIVTEDFSHWTFRSLLRPHKWREVLRSGVDGGMAGLFVVNSLGFIFIIAFIVVLIFFMVQGGLVAPQIRELFTGSS